MRPSGLIAVASIILRLSFQEITMPALIDFDATPPDHSTWGPPQGGWTRIAAGIYSCSTASHGGYWLSPARLDAMPDTLRAQSWNGTSPWFEEDCDVLLVVRAFPDLFSAEMREYAEKDRLSRILMAKREAARQKSRV
ncbi:hypothetical protein D3Y57_01005 (plasmid) [Sphingomonas paeninsulae]|uniref:DUF7007 domain-containing protein n=2 Tax=Sphingomonas paeninsulae TaxID=2319844 RepID=A0A494TGY5_SPHPE|nr:hypothetical protein D3Y57_01005 [Sphingomonas paeninsulae]